MRRRCLLRQRLKLSVRKQARRDWNKKGNKLLAERFKKINQKQYKTSLCARRLKRIVLNRKLMKEELRSFNRHKQRELKLKTKGNMKKSKRKKERKLKEQKNLRKSEGRRFRDKSKKKRERIRWCWQSKDLLKRNHMLWNSTLKTWVWKIFKMSQERLITRI